MRSTVALLVALAGCAAPFAPDSGGGEAGDKADAADTFFARSHRFELDRVAGLDRLATLGPDGASATLGGVRVRLDGSSHSGGELKATRDGFVVQLKDSDRVAGMRTFRFVRGELDGFAAARVMAAAGVATARVTHASLVVNGGDQGTFLLVEHDGPRFLEAHFGGEDGQRLTPDEIASRVRPGDGPYTLGTVIDVVADARFAAGARATGGAIDHDYFDVCDGAAGQDLAGGTARWCAAPVARVAFGAFSDVGAPSTATDRATYEAALAEALRCLDTASCVRTPVERRAAELGVDATGLLDAIDARAETIRAELALAASADVADGDSRYGSLVRSDGGFEARYRHLDASHVATSVDLLTTARGRETRVAMRFDREANLWRAPLAAGTEVLRRVLEVRDETGLLHTVTQPDVPLDDVDVLAPIDTYDIDVREPSGLAMTGGLLYCVSDHDSRVYALDPASGRVRDDFRVDGEGAEAIAFDPLFTRLLVGFEDDHAVRAISFEGDTLGDERFGWADDGNGGIEGVAFRSFDGHAFIAKEKSPVRIYEIDAQGSTIERFDPRFSSDLSDLTWSETDQRLYALSDEDRALYRLDSRMRVERRFPLDIDNPEGLAIEGGRVYIVSDEDEVLHVFSLGLY